VKEYHKIYSPFVRHTDGPLKNKFDQDAWAKPEFEYLCDKPWMFTEKINGTNIRIHWDGHKAALGGRTDNAQLPAKLVEMLNDSFPEELFEQAFGESEATLYGEGFGAGIQKGGVYRQDQGFALFDVRVGDWWLKREDVEDVASKLGAEIVPVVAQVTLNHMIHVVRCGALPSSAWGNAKPEGVVGTPVVPLFNRAGERIIVKIKYKDFT